ncbi:disulfide bond formation protein B [Poseidonocella sp. HB161398]|uniref:disulfide bond formation protein B n=1 Tax=Poseidonocella sp. HB161398 TaxID=2320855 RepID=UPI00110803E1|nr:disulfide bond formation protein B [Poseidonocella sp. HB161398]
MTHSLPRLAALAAGAGSLALLLGAFAFQHIGGISPCPMCLWQRWPHAIAALLALAALILGRLRPAALLGAAAMAVSTGLGLFHSGVERGWWQGPDTCTSGPIGNLSPDQLMEQIMAAPLVRCDEIAWELFGLTMANYNAIISAGLFALWVFVLVKAPGRG